MSRLATMSSTRAFERLFDRPPGWRASAPGRVNLLGAHVDYHEGWVLPGAIDRGLSFAAAERTDRLLRVAALDMDRTVEIDLEALPPPRPEREAEPSQWHDLIAGIAWACRRRGLEARGLDLAFGGDLPMAAGVSSSAAVEAGLLLLWNQIEGWELDRTALAELGQLAENGYLGVGSGIMDQLACLHGRQGELLLIDCRTLDHRFVAMPKDVEVLVLDSGVRRRLAESGFNQRRRECDEALRRLRETGLDLASLRDLTAEQLTRARDALEPVHERRARHVVDECKRVLDAAESLAARDTASLGRLMTRSHASSRDLYEVSVAELDLLADSATRQPGCLGARLSGGGFGGCVTALVERGTGPEVEAAVARRFANRFGRRPEAFSCRIADGAEVTRWP